MKIGDVAKFFNCTERHIDRLVTEGRFLRPVYVGAIKRWSLADLEAWASRNKKSPGEPDMATQDWIDAAEQDDPIIPAGRMAGLHLSDPHLRESWLKWISDENKKGWVPPIEFRQKCLDELARRAESPRST